MTTDPSVEGDPTPRLTAAEAARLAAEAFGLAASATLLPSERDQNFVLGAGDGRAFVLKIANAAEQHAVLELQNAVFAHLHRSAPELAVPEVVRSTAGHEITTYAAADGRTHLVRLLGWLDGELLVKVAPHSPALLASLGAVLGRLDRALASFSHPAMQRVLHWDLKHADHAFRHLPLIAPALRPAVTQFIGAWQRIRWEALRHQVIHGDANDYNVLVRDGRVVGLLDFGDMVHSAAVCELAIALAYAMLGKPDPVAAVLPVIRAYHAEFPLTVAERAALYPLTTARLCMSVCHAAFNARAKSEDAYQQVTAAPAADLLGRLAALPAGHAHRLFLEACEPA